MSKEAAKSLVDLLTRELKGNWSQRAMKGIWDELCEQPDKALFAAGDYLCLNSNGFLPAPQKILDCVKAEARKVNTELSKQREQDWADTKEKPEDGPTLFKFARDEHAKYALMGIQLMRRTDKTREEKLEFFKVMDVRYPGAGWAKEGAKLQQHWERKQNASQT